MVKNLWNHSGTFKSDLDSLVYRSNIIGADRSIANWGGGNTSVKTVEKDFRGNEVDVLWVKGSGSDLATMGPENFTCLNMKYILPLLEKEDMTDDEMVSYLSYCMLNPKHPRSSIETLLHAFLPFKHVDHTHPDAIISIACADNGKQVAEEIFGDRLVWVPYFRPGFKLSKMISEGVRQNPNAELVIMEKHGLVTWGNTSQECYEQTLSVINEAEEYIEERAIGKKIFGGMKYKTLDKSAREEILTKILPIVRGVISEKNRMIVTYDDSEEVINFVNSYEAKELSLVGAACPDHLVHTKRVPLFIEWDVDNKNVEALIEKIKEGINEYKEEYQKYFERNRSNNEQIIEGVPRVILIPGIGMINSGKSWNAADISRQLYHRAISVMRGATVLGNFVSLNEKESFDIEYWPLELYKLSLAPPESEFSRQIAFITGAAGGIGSATSYRLAAEGAHLVLADINYQGAKEVAEEINKKYGKNRAIAVHLDVTKEEDVKQAIKESILFYGGLDIVVNNAGLASSSPIEDTTLEQWNMNIDVLLTGYFLVARETFKVLKSQSIGGSMIFVGSKNSIYSGKNVAAYSTAKAGEVHLARTIAVDGGEYGIRVNIVLPDAIIRGSKIWDSNWKKERANSYGIDIEELEEHYRKRTLLNVNVFPEDVAESIAFLASKKSAKTTGCMITIDGGVASAFTR